MAVTGKRERKTDSERTIIQRMIDSRVNNALNSLVSQYGLDKGNINFTRNYSLFTGSGGVTLGGGGGSGSGGTDIMRALVLGYIGTGTGVLTEVSRQRLKALGMLYFYDDAANNQIKLIACSHSDPSYWMFS